MFNINNYDAWRRSVVFIVNFEHTLPLAIVLLLLTLNKEMLAGYNHGQNIRDKLEISCKIAHCGKSSISIFLYFFFN